VSPFDLNPITSWVLDRLLTRRWVRHSPRDPLGKAVVIGDSCVQSPVQAADAVTVPRRRNCSTCVIHAEQGGEITRERVRAPRRTQRCAASCELCQRRTPTPKMLKPNAQLPITAQKLSISPSPLRVLICKRTPLSNFRMPGTGMSLAQTLKRSRRASQQACGWHSVRHRLVGCQVVVEGFAGLGVLIGFIDAESAAGHGAPNTERLAETVSPAVVLRRCPSLSRSKARWVRVTSR
jgi:hypothetical protein